MTGPELAGCNTRPGERGDPISRLPSRAGTVPAFLGENILDSPGHLRYSPAMDATPTQTPETLLDAVRYFADPDVALAFMATVRWPDGNVKCPTCGSADVSFLSSRRLWKCSEDHPRRQFSIKVGTIME